MHQPRQSQLPFRPPVHRKQERGHHSKRSPKAAQRKSVRTYADVALHVMGGNEADMTSLRSSISPSNSLTQPHNRSATGSASAESSLSRDTVSQTSSLKGSSLSKKRSKKDLPFCMEGEIYESSLYEPPQKPESPKSKTKQKQENDKFEENLQIQTESTLLDTTIQSQTIILETAAPLKNSEISRQSGASEATVSDQDVEINVSRDQTRRHNNGITLTGTIKRGKKEDMVNVVLTPGEIAVLNKATSRERKESEKRGKCACASGPHVLLLSLFYVPFAFLSSLFLSFYTGSLCWYNVYIYLSEECSIVYKIFLCPLLIISYPLYIVVTSFAIALFAIFVQISWRFSSWQREIKNLDKNFYGWLCNILGIPQCAPYDIIILDDDAQNIEATECLGDRP